MSGLNAYTEDYEHIELFGEPGLFTNGRIDRSTVPDGWYCYDLRGSDDDPGDPSAVEESVSINHAGTVLLPAPLELNEIDETGTHYKTIHEDLDFIDGEITMKEFCEEHGIKCPERKPKYKLRPTAAEDIPLFYSSEERDLQPATVGHEHKAIQSFSVNGDSREAADRQDFIKVELILHKHKLKALEDALQEEGTTVEEMMQEYLLSLYAEKVPFHVQQEIREKIDGADKDRDTPHNTADRTKSTKVHRRTGGECR